MIMANKKGGWTFIPERVPAFKVEAAHWKWIPWCTQKSTFGGLTPDEKKEKELHKKYQCTGRNFAKESDQRCGLATTMANAGDEFIKKFKETASWNRPVEHDPVETMEVD